ncbi:MAG: sigma-70 family RNA polymerase sigma factor [Solirubrobacteraceae bacterium]
MEASVIHAPAGPRRSAAGGVLLRLRSDDQLVALFRMGYEEAFGVIHDRYRARLLAYTRQMLSRSSGDAEDVLQDVFLRAYSALRQDDRPVTLRAWLYRVAHNRCIDHLRRPEPPLGEIYEIQRRPVKDPPAETERRERLRHLVDDVQRLPEQQRSALLMRELEGLSYTELADALGVSVPAVKSLLVRARCGLVEADEARNAACLDIRADLDCSLGRGVRASARSRRHLRDCEPCRTYRVEARRTHQGLRALVPTGGPIGALAKLLGLGGAGSAAGAGAGGSAAVVSTGAAATATKVVAVVCCAAVVGGGAAELRSAPPARVPAASPHRAAATRATATADAGPSPHLIAPPRIAADPLSTREAVAPAPKPHEKSAPTAPAAPDEAPELAPIRSTVPTEEPATTTPAEPAPTPEAAVDAATATATGGALAPEEDAAPQDAAAPAATGTASPAG